jgi:Amt family ammonium transporter
MQLLVQLIGVVVIWTVIFGLAYGFFKIQNKLMSGGIRPSAEMELEGMDMPEMGAYAYPEFHLHGGEVTGPGGGSPTIEEERLEPTPVD